MRARAHRIATTGPRFAAAAAVVTALLAVAGCGGGGNGDGARARTAATAATGKPASSREFPPRADDATSREVAAIAERYLQAVAARDAAAACATRAPSDRRRLVAVTHRTCEQAFRAVFEKVDPSKARGEEVLGVRRLGVYAVASVRFADGRVAGGAGGIVAQRVGGRWLLVDRDPTQQPRPHVSAATAKAVRAVADRYLRALAAKDYTAACATRTPQDRRQFADFSGGSCADGLEATTRYNSAIRGKHAGKVTLDRADTARVEVLDRDLSGSFESLTAKRIGAEWLLVDAGDTYDLP